MAAVESSSSVTLSSTHAWMISNQLWRHSAPTPPFIGEDVTSVVSLSSLSPLWRRSVCSTNTPPTDGAASCPLRGRGGKGETECPPPPEIPSENASFLRYSTSSGSSPVFANASRSHHFSRPRSRGCRSSPGITQYDSMNSGSKRGTRPSRPHRAIQRSARFTS